MCEQFYWYVLMIRFSFAFILFCILFKQWFLILHNYALLKKPLHRKNMVCVSKWAIHSSSGTLYMGIACNDNEERLKLSLLFILISTFECYLSIQYKFVGFSNILYVFKLWWINSHRVTNFTLETNVIDNKWGSQIYHTVFRLIKERKKICFIRRVWVN